MIAPFPYFGGKRMISETVWSLFGADVPNYVEPFFGSGAVLLSRPGWSPNVNWTETVNDKDGMISNFWRAVQQDPEEVAHWADWPCNENDLHARHVWLRSQIPDLTRLLEGDPDYCDAKVAGWWVWGICLWIGGGWCGPYANGPWSVVECEDGLPRLEKGERGVKRQLVNLGNAGKGVHRQLVHLGDAGMGVHRQLVHLGDAGMGVEDFETAGRGEEGLINWMFALSERLRRVRVCSGDWSRICGPTPTVKHGTTAVFLDPPYGDADRAKGCYSVDSFTVAADVRKWCAEHGDDLRLRIVFCGYRGEHDTLEEQGWSAIPWKAHGGYGGQGKSDSLNGRANALREVLWVSPRCLIPQANSQLSLMDATTG